MGNGFCLPPFHLLLVMQQQAQYDFALSPQFPEGTTCFFASLSPPPPFERPKSNSAPEKPATIKARCNSTVQRRRAALPTLVQFLAQINTVNDAILERHGRRVAAADPGSPELADEVMNRLATASLASGYRLRRMAPARGRVHTGAAHARASSRAVDFG